MCLLYISIYRVNKLTFPVISEQREVLIIIFLRVLLFYLYVFQLCANYYINNSKYENNKNNSEK